MKSTKIKQGCVQGVHHQRNYFKKCCFDVFNPLLPFYIKDHKTFI